jgi:hypothetical protein
MTGKKASPMRRRVCVSCQTKFVPKRLDAVTCSDRCRMAEHRRREARAKAESHFKSQQVIAQNTFDQARQLEHHQHLAMRQNLSADGIRRKHIRFMGIQRGVLAVQGVLENDLPWPVPWRPFLGRWLKVSELKHDPANPEAGDPEVIEAVVDALQHETLGGSFMQREFEKECRALLRGPVKRISLFTVAFRDIPLPHWPYLVPAQPESSVEWPEGWEEGNAPRDRGPAVDASDLDLVFGSGGFTIFDGSKGHP